MQFSSSTSNLMAKNLFVLLTLKKIWIYQGKTIACSLQHLLKEFFKNIEKLSCQILCHLL